jgi:hypothetical protein
MADGIFSFDAFLSHNSRDKKRVREIAKRLRNKGLKIWFDEWEIKPSMDILIAVEKGLAESRTFVLCMSAAAFNSEWVTLERNTIRFRNPNNRDRAFVPLYLEDCEVPDIIKGFRYIDFRKETETAWQDLFSVLSDRTRSRFLGESHVSIAEKVFNDNDKSSMIRKAPVNPYIMMHEIPATLIKSLSNSIDSPYLTPIVKQTNVLIKKIPGDQREIEMSLIAPPQHCSPLQAWTDLIRTVIRTGPRNTICFILIVSENEEISPDLRVELETLVMNIANKYSNK